MKQKGGVLTRSMAKKLEQEGKKSEEKKTSSSSNDSNEAGPSNQVKKPSTRKKTTKKESSSSASKGSNEAGPSVQVKKTAASKKKPVDEKKEIKKIENQFKAEMVGLLADKEDAIKNGAQVKLALIERQIEVLTQMKNKVEEDIDDELATLEEVKQELALWRARKTALIDEVREQLNEEEARIKEAKKQANAEKYKITKFKKVLRDELKELRYENRRIWNPRERNQNNVLIQILEGMIENMPNNVQELVEIIQEWNNIKANAKEQLRIEIQREWEEARRRAEEDRVRQQAWLQGIDEAAQRALRELDQRAERIRIEEEEARRREQQREEIRKGKQPIIEKKQASTSKISQLSKTEKSVSKVTKSLQKLKIYENKMKTIPKPHIEYVQNGIEMFKKFVRLGRELLQKNRNPSLAEIKDYTGFHLHRDASNTVTLQENLNYAEKVTKDLEKSLTKDPVYYTRIFRLNPFEYYCIDGKLDKVASVIYGDHVWQSDKDLDSNLARVIENYITPYCDDINLLYSLKGADNIKKAIDMYEHIHIKKVEEAVLNYPEVKKLCNTKAQCDIIHKKLHDLLKDPDSFMSITQEDNEQYVACSEDIPTLAKLRQS